MVQQQHGRGDDVSKISAMPSGVSVAGLGARAGAAIIDVLPLAVVSGALSLFLTLAHPSTTVMIVVTILAAVVSLGWVLYVWWGYATRGAGPGAKVMGIQVLGLRDGRPIGWGRSFLRELVWGAAGFFVIPWIVLVVMMVTHQRRQGWHDLAAKAVAVRRVRPVESGGSVTRSSVQSANAVGLPAHLAGSSFAGQPAATSSELPSSIGYTPTALGSGTGAGPISSIPSSLAPAPGLDSAPTTMYGATGPVFPGPARPDPSVPPSYQTLPVAAPQAAPQATPGGQWGSAATVPAPGYPAAQPSYPSNPQQGYTTQPSSGWQPQQGDPANPPLGYGAQSQSQSQSQSQPSYATQPQQGDPTNPHSGDAMQPQPCPPQPTWQYGRVSAGEPGHAMRPGSAPQHEQPKPGEMLSGYPSQPPQSAQRAVQQPAGQSPPQGPPEQFAVAAQAPYAPPQRALADPDDYPSTHLASRAPGVPQRGADVGWQIRLDDGRVIDIDGLVLIGRNPVARPDETVAHLISAGADSRMVSKTHLAFGTDQRGLYVTDRGSTNGTAIAGEGGQLEPCAPGEKVRLREGQIVSFGDHHVEVRRTH